MNLKHIFFDLIVALTLRSAVVDKSDRSMEPPVDSEITNNGKVSRNRPRLLHCFASSLMSIGHKSFSRAEHHLGGGSLRRVVRGAAFAAGPFVRRAEQNWLTSLSFVDRFILFAEKMLLFVFPPIEPVFAKIDELVFFANSLPRKFDEVLDHDIPKAVEHLPLAQVGCLLKHLANKIMKMNSRKNNVEEREIKVVEIDSDCRRRLDYQGGGEEKKNLEWTDDDMGSERDENSSVDEDYMKHEVEKNGNDRNDVVGHEELADGKGNGGAGGGKLDNVGGELTKIGKGGKGKGKGRGKAKTIKSKVGGPLEGSNKSEGVMTRDPMQMLDEGWQQKGI